VGELLVGGEGLALGYLGQGELTAQRFVPHPLVAGERLYRTGDLARWRGDGVLEFLGRADGQVKINGHRIEPGEIESVLRDIPGVADAAVTVVENNLGSRQLHAFVVPEAGPASPSGLIEQASAQAARLLPKAMHPRTIRQIEQLPMTTNGKVDRALLATLVEKTPSAPRKPRPVPSSIARWNCWRSRRKSGPSGPMCWGSTRWRPGTPCSIWAPSRCRSSASWRA
jgi:acyl-coenzyme A synthetase/AMP-(fatty) acid ligase